LELHTLGDNGQLESQRGQKLKLKASLEAEAHFFECNEQVEQKLVHLKLMYYNDNLHLGDVRTVGHFFFHQDKQRPSFDRSSELPRSSRGRGQDCSKLARLRVPRARIFREPLHH